MCVPPLGLAMGSPRQRGRSCWHDRHSRRRILHQRSGRTLRGCAGIDRRVDGVELCAMRSASSSAAGSSDACRGHFDGEHSRDLSWPARSATAGLGAPQTIERRCGQATCDMYGIRFDQHPDLRCRHHQHPQPYRWCAPAGALQGHKIGACAWRRALFPHRHVAKAKRCTDGALRPRQRH